jgi:hypothetical protein
VARSVTYRTSEQLLLDKIDAAIRDRWGKGVEVFSRSDVEADRFGVRGNTAERPSSAHHPF